MTDTASIVRIYTGVKGDKGDPGVADDASVAALVADPESATGAQLESTIVAVASTRQNVLTAQRISTTQASPMADQGATAFRAIDPAGAPLLTVSPSVSRQQVTGVGAAVTDSSAYLFMVKLSKAQRHATLVDLFGPESGAFQWIRVPLGGSDFNLVAERSIADMPVLTTSAAVTAGGTTISCTSSQAVFAVGDTLVVDAAPTGTLIALAVAAANTLDISVSVPVGATLIMPSEAERTVTAVSSISGGYRITLSAANVQAHSIGTIVQGAGVTLQETVTVTAATTGTSPYVTTVSPFVNAHASGTKFVKRDPTLTAYSFAHEGNYLIPLLKEIQAVNPGITVLGDIWLVPLWMKSTLTSAIGVLRDEEFPYHANFIVKMVTDMVASGVTVDVLSVQNEPSSPSASLTYYTPEKLIQLTQLVRDGLNTAGLYEVKIQTHGSQFNNDDYVVELADVDGARELVDYVGWHAYSGNAVDSLPSTRKFGKPSLLTEIRSLLTDNWYSTSLVMAGDVIIAAMRVGFEASVLWNLALDPVGNPTQGSTGRRGVITIASDGTGAVTKFADYYALKHFSKFVKPGAVRVDSTLFGVAGRTGTDLQSVAFRNADGSVILYAFNSSPSTDKTVQIVDDRVGAGFTATIAHGELVTFVWGATSDSTLLTPELPAPPTPGPATVAPTLADTATTHKSSSQAAATLSFTHTYPSAGSNLCAVVIVGGTDGPDGYTWERSVTLAGVPMLLAGFANASSGSSVRRVAVYYLINPPSGAQTVVAASTGREYLTAVTFTLQGVDPNAPTGAASDSGGTSTGAATVTGVGGTATDYVVSALSARTTATLTPGTGLTVLQHAEVSNMWLSVAAQTGASDPVSAWTFTPQSSPDVYALAQVAFHGVAS